MLIFELFSLVRSTTQWMRWGSRLVQAFQVTALIVLFIFAGCLLLNGIAAAILQGETNATR